MVCKIVNISTDEARKEGLLAGVYSDTFEAHVESIPHAEFKGQGQILIKVTEVKVTQQRTMVKVTAEVNECKLGNRDIYIN